MSNSETGISENPCCYKPQETVQYTTNIGLASHTSPQTDSSSIERDEEKIHRPSSITNRHWPGTGHHPTKSSSIIIRHPLRFQEHQECVLVYLQNLISLMNSNNRCLGLCGEGAIAAAGGAFFIARFTHWNAIKIVLPLLSGGWAELFDGRH